MHILRVLLVASLALAVTAQADFRRDYSSSLRDFDKENYESAIINLENAIKDKNSAKEDVRFYGMSFAPYIPHFYLGQSYFKLKDCSNALLEWNKSLDQGVVKSQSKEFLELQKNRAICERDTVDPPAALQLAVDEYFVGNFQKAARINPAAMTQNRAKIQALLFRAASNFNLFLLSGEKELELLELSKKDISKIRTLDSNFSPYSRAFSPRFLLLFN